ncbi:hypothetical protein EQG41_01900 [Billgrantia azerbaijanica]|nr:hypothetical protein EQG41_01900 [Halomonas azerbaijanica]
MPTTRSKRIARLVVGPGDLVMLADAHEQAELTRYRRLAFSFLTFNRATSRLMASLGIHCEMRVAELRRASQQLGLPQPAASNTRQGGAATHPYFISTQGMAIDALTRAVTDAEYSQRFYEHLRKISATPALQPILLAIIHQKQAEHTVLQEYANSRNDLAYRAASAG